MKTLEKLTVCHGVSSDNYERILPPAFDACVFKTANGQPGAFLERDPTNAEKKVIRSSKCSTYLLASDDTNCCQAC